MMSHIFQILCKIVCTTTTARGEIVENVGADANDNYDDDHHHGDA